MNGESNYRGVHPRLVTKIIASYVSNHNIAPEQIPELINSVHQTIDRLGRPAEAAPVLVPAVPIRRSVHRDYVVCLDCGWKGKMLRRHLSTRHGFGSDEYLKRWGLPSDHPLTAPTYSEQRSNLAKELGLGRGSRPAESAAAANQPAPAPTPARRSRRPAPRSPAEG